MGNAPSDTAVAPQNIFGASNNSPQVNQYDWVEGRGLVKRGQVSSMQVGIYYYLLVMVPVHRQSDRQSFSINDCLIGMQPFRQAAG